MARTKEIKLRFNADEYEALKERAGSNIFAKWCRAELLKAPLPYKPITKFNVLDPALLVALHRIGVNINQIAKQLNNRNLFDSSISRLEFLHFLAMLEGIEAEIKELKNVNQAVKK